MTGRALAAACALAAIAVPGAGAGHTSDYFAGTWKVTSAGSFASHVTFRRATYDAVTSVFTNADDIPHYCRSSSATLYLASWSGPGGTGTAVGCTRRSNLRLAGHLFDRSGGRGDFSITAAAPGANSAGKIVSRFGGTATPPLATAKQPFWAEFVAHEGQKPEGKPEDEQGETALVQGQRYVVEVSAGGTVERRGAPALESDDGAVYTLQAVSASLEGRFLHGGRSLAGTGTAEIDLTFGKTRGPGPAKERLKLVFRLAKGEPTAAAVGMAFELRLVRPQMPECAKGRFAATKGPPDFVSLSVCGFVVTLQSARVDVRRVK